MIIVKAKSIRSIKSKFIRYSPRRKYANITWTFNPFDDDYWPSIPHGHGYLEKHAYKLDVFTGKVFNKDHDVIAVIRKKDLKELTSDSGFIEIEKKANNYYKEKHPDVYDRLGYPKVRQGATTNRRIFCNIRRVGLKKKLVDVYQRVIPIEIK